MATRQMYMQKPDEFLLWYYKRFAKYRHIKPNSVHKWLVTKKLITQNIDGLDGKAGNSHFIPIHGRLDKVTILDEEGVNVDLIDAPWDEIARSVEKNASDTLLKKQLLDTFRIPSTTNKPEPRVSLKPFVLLFDEYYTDMYRMREAQAWMQQAEAFVFMGTSFSVGITAIALETAIRNRCRIDIVDPAPVDLGVPGIRYHSISASDYIAALECE